MSEQLQEDLPKVIAELEKKCLENPQSVTAFHHLGLVFMKAGRMDEAIKALERAVEIDPLNGDAMINLGAIHFGRKPFPFGRKVRRLMQIWGSSGNREVSWKRPWKRTRRPSSMTPAWQQSG